MKTLKINKITIKDWCIFENMELEPKNKIYISGDNETGKSRLASAITWCLNGTDIDGNTLNDVIPTHREQSLSPTVSLEMSIIEDSGTERPLSLEKCFKAGLTRSKEYNGEHTNEIKLNGVKVSQKKVSDYIEKNLCDVELFNMLSNVYVFTENLKVKGKELAWQIQRRIVTSLIKDLGTEEEQAKQEKYKPLETGILKHGNISDFQKEIKQTLADLQSEIDKFPTQIEMLKSDFDDDVEKTSKELQAELQEKKKAREEYNKNNQTYREARILKQQQEKEQRTKDLIQEKDRLQTECNKLKSENADKKTEVFNSLLSIQNMYSSHKRQLDELELRLKDERNKSIAEVCSKCGSPLDKNGIEKAKKDKEKAISDYEKVIESEKKHCNNYAKEYNEKKKEYDSFKEIEPPKELQELTDKINLIYSEVSTPVEDLEGYEDTIAEYNNLCTDLQAEYQKAIKNEEINDKIKRLRENNKQNMKKYSEQKMLEDLSKEFVSERCSEIERKANDLFSGTGIKFKMFRKVETTGENRETFEIYYNGKEYHKQLSLSTKKLVSYWITLKLQEAYDLRCFLVLDNMESVNFKEESENQMFILTRVEEKCPACGGGKSSRRNADGTWTCECGNVWKKELKIE